MDRLDAYLTREPVYLWPPDPETRHCVFCGCFLKQSPDATRDFTALEFCSGNPQVITGCKHDESVLMIIGEEHRDDEFTVAYSPACGGKEAPEDHLPHGYPEEIRPEDAPSYEHEPHFMESSHGSPTGYLRICTRCGCTNEEVVL